MKLSEKAASKHHHIMVFGSPKSGKTELVGDASSDFDLLWFDLEKGHETLFKLPRAQQERIELICLPDTRGYPIAIETMLKVIKGAPVEICEAHGKVSCPACKKAEAPFVRVCLNELPSTTVVVVDSITQLTNSAIAHITKNQDADYKLNYDDWGNLGKLMDTFFSYVQQANYNIVCISHETEVDMEDGKAKLVPTAGTRNFSRNTAKYFDEVLYCEVKNKRHVVGSSTVYSGNVLTGSRTGAVMETSAGKPSIVPILKGLVIPAAPIHQNTPATKAAGTLAALAAQARKGN